MTAPRHIDCDILCNLLAKYDLSGTTRNRRPQTGVWILHKNPGDRGFTLIELMIVIVIIGIIAAFAVPNYIRYQRKAKIGRTATEMKRLSGAFFAYVAEHGDFPTDSHLVLPPGMEEYINPQIWADATPLGGNYNWEGPDNYPYAGLSILNPTAPPEDLRTLDAMLDNGDINTGQFRLGTGGRPTLIISE